VTSNPTHIVAERPNVVVECSRDWLPDNKFILYCNGFDQHVAGSNSVNTAQYETVEEAVFSMSSAPSNSTNGVL
jgi:hypothetical protein